jgi:DNA-binding NarL/FixJ family response regulator
MSEEKQQVVLKVVTVDDSPLIAQRLKVLLGDLNDIELQGNAENIQSALDLIEKERPHVVFVDINLSLDKPRNGIDLLNVLRKTYPVLKIVMLTNLADSRYRDMCRSFGADYFLDKSEDFDRIPETLMTIRNEGFDKKNESWWASNTDLWR